MDRIQGPCTGLDPGLDWTLDWTELDPALDWKGSRTLDWTGLDPGLDPGLDWTGLERTLDWTLDWIQDPEIRPVISNHLKILFSVI